MIDTWSRSISAQKFLRIVHQPGRACVCVRMAISPEHRCAWGVPPAAGGTRPGMSIGLLRRAVRGSVERQSDLGKAAPSQSPEYNAEIPPGRVGQPFEPG